MNLEEEIKKEVYEYVSKQNLSQDEIDIIDSYVLRLIQTMKPIFVSHENILGNKENIKMFKQEILKSIKEL